MDMSDYKISDKNFIRYIFTISDNFSNIVWTIPLKNKNSKTVTDEF